MYSSQTQDRILDLMFSPLKLHPLVLFEEYTDTIAYLITLQLYRHHLDKDGEKRVHDNTCSTAYPLVFGSPPKKAGHATSLPAHTARTLVSTFLFCLSAHAARCVGSPAAGCICFVQLLMYVATNMSIGLEFGILVSPLLRSTVKVKFRSYQAKFLLAHLTSCLGSFVELEMRGSRNVDSQNNC
jgi:hypothetical protein